MLSFFRQFGLLALPAAAGLFVGCADSNDRADIDDDDGVTTVQRDSATDSGAERPQEITARKFADDVEQGEATRDHDADRGTEPITPGSATAPRTSDPAAEPGAIPESEPAQPTPDAGRTDDAGGPAAAETRRTFIDRMKADLKDLETEMDELKSRSAKLMEGAREKWDKAWMDLQARRGEFREHLDSLSEATAENWKELQAGAALAWTRLKEALKNAKDEVDGDQSGAQERPAPTTAPTQPNPDTTPPTTPESETNPDRSPLSTPETSSGATSEATTDTTSEKPAIESPETTP